MSIHTVIRCDNCDKKIKTSANLTNLEVMLDRGDPLIKPGMSHGTKVYLELSFSLKITGKVGSGWVNTPDLCETCARKLLSRFVGTANKKGETNVRKSHSI